MIDETELAEIEERVAALESELFVGNEDVAFLKTTVRRLLGDLDAALEEVAYLEVLLDEKDDEIIFLRADRAACEAEQKQLEDQPNHAQHWAKPGEL